MDQPSNLLEAVLDAMAAGGPGDVDEVPAHRDALVRIARPRKLPLRCGSDSGVAMIGRSLMVQPVQVHSTPPRPMEYRPGCNG